VGEVKVAAATAIINTLKLPAEADRGLLARLHDSRSPYKSRRSFAAPIVPVFRATRHDSQNRFGESICPAFPVLPTEMSSVIGIVSGSHAPFLSGSSTRSSASIP